MKLLVGLGNPGEKYTHTRHNLGFMVVEQFLKDHESLEHTVWSRSDKLKSDVFKAEHFVIAKPLTYMNNSGMAVSLLASYYKIAPEDIWIVYDELDLPVGSLKIRFGGAAAGHHGVESIIEHLGTDKFWRFRLGIGATHPHTRQEAQEDERGHAVSRQEVKNAEEFVLGAFGSGEQGKVRELIKRGSDSLQLALEKGLEEAQKRYNTK